ncbi:MAG TPA: CAP domain-containing protein [Sphingomicrobium sp.]|nr:CAP domain-containing protein [Sphingomicrobium sp.]
MQFSIRTFMSVALLFSSPLLTGASAARADFNQRLLAAHNVERSAAGVPPLAWSDELEAEARAWANTLAATGRFEHSPDEVASDLEGENLWAGTPHAYSPEAMVGLWSSEKKNYRPGIFPNNSLSGEIDDVGHYTQLIWRSSRKVGCATAIGKSEEYLVCRYSRAGNVYGERPA